MKSTKDDLLSQKVDEVNEKASNRDCTIQCHQSSSNTEKQRTGRYLAAGVIVIMIFITVHHTLMRHVTVLAGLLAPVMIMLLYILWLLYFAKKKEGRLPLYKVLFYFLLQILTQYLMELLGVM